MAGMTSIRTFHVTGINMDILWRQRRRLPKNITSAGPLTDLPDYSFVDGRPTPLGVSGHKPIWSSVNRTNSKICSASSHEVYLTLINSIFLLLSFSQTRQFVRLQRQQKIASRIVEGIDEIDFAKERYQKSLHAREQTRQQIVNSKLKPKGILLNEQNRK